MNHSSNAVVARGSQLTVRGVPRHVDRALRQRAKRENRSLNSVLVQALAQQAGIIDSESPRFTDLDHLAGKWECDADFDQAIAAQDQVDEELWR